MSRLSISAGMLLATLCGFATTSGHSAMLAPTLGTHASSARIEAMPEHLIPAQARGRRPVYRSPGPAYRNPGPARGVVVVRPVRPWVARPYFGAVVAGVTLGTVIAATAVATAPVAPSPTLCWYWADPAMIQGYWDYCKPR